MRVALFRRLAVPAAVVLSLVIPGAAAMGAANTTDGPYAWTGPDSGTCHPMDQNNNEVPWALDLGNRVFTQGNPDPAGNRHIVERFTAGTWRASPDPGPNGGSLPPAGPKVNYSPGACDSGTDNGHRIAAGTAGTFYGVEYLFIQGGSYSAGDGTCAGEDDAGSPKACTTDSYVAYHYPGGTSVLTGYRFTYTRTANGKTQRYSDVGKSDGTGGNFMYSESGDVYTSTAS